MRKLFLAIAVATLSLIPPARAQQKPPSLEAHRLYFVAITTNAVEGVETPALASYLDTAGVAKSEHKAAVEALWKFKTRYFALIDAYNHSPSTLAGNNDDTPLFLAQRDMLVQNTIELLQASLSVTSFNNLTDRVRHDSHNIKSAGIDPTMTEHRHGAKFSPVQGSMRPMYSASRSESVSWDASGNAWVYETPVVDGYTNCSYCSSFYHHGWVTNTLNGGTQVTGPYVTAPSYISVSNQQVAEFLNNCFNPDGTLPCEDDGTENAGVICSGTGSNIFQWNSPPGFKFRLEAAVTFSQVTGRFNGGAYLQDWCQLQYEPPDYNPNLLLNASPDATYAIGAAALINSTWNSGFWLVLPPGGISTSLTGTYTRKYCTHNVPPY